MFNLIVSFIKISVKTKINYFKNILNIYFDFFGYFKVAPL